MEEVKERLETMILKFSDFYNKLKTEGGGYESWTPDGWMPIGDVYLKRREKQKNYFSSGNSIITSTDHLFEVLTEDLDENSDIFDRLEFLDGSTWIRSKNLKGGDRIISEAGYDTFISSEYIGFGDTFDFEILSNNHRYFSNGLSSHNTGKSSIAEGLAQRIVQKKCSRNLFNKRIMVLDLATLVSGTKFRGQFEERVKSLMTEVENNPDIILFIDEIHTLVGAGGSSGSLDASNMFKPALAKGDLQVIGATTLDEYRKHIEKDGALERRFQKVIVNPSTPEETLLILNNIKDKYEEHHNVIFSEDAIKACVQLTDRYLPDRFLPDKAIDALDEAGSRVHISNIEVPKEILDIENQILELSDLKSKVIREQKFEEAGDIRDREKKLKSKLDKLRISWEEDLKNNKKVVSDVEVAEVISMMSGVPVNKVSESDNDKLSKMYSILSKTVIGQDEAVKKITKAIQRGRIGMKDPNKPIFVGLLTGSSGSGKTFLAKQIAKYLFDSEDSMIRIDMSEYMDKISTSKILGSPQGYVGYDDSNVLDQIRRKPYSVILLDEIEKAHPDIYNLFLQAFDDGHMTDSHGRRISFKNSIILMTSNTGIKKMNEFGTGIGFETKARQDSKEKDVSQFLESELKKRFAPEFLNRIDDIIYFRDLSNEDISKIIDLELVKTLERAKSLGYNINLSQSLKDHLIKVGFDPQYGARPLKRAIQKWIDDYFTEWLIEENPEVGDVDLDYNADLDKTVIVKKVVKTKRGK